MQYAKYLFYILHTKIIKVKSNSVFDDWPLIRALIHATKEKESLGGIGQTDYQRIIIAMMPYFLYNTYYTFLPEFVTAASKPIYLLCRVETEVGQKYGNLEVRALYNGRTEHRTSWPSFIQELAVIADTHKNLDNKLWVIATRGFNFCAFKYDKFNYLDQGTFSNFEPLNLAGWTKAELARAKIEYLVAPGKPEIITVINWRLDDQGHQELISDMLSYISSHNP